MSDHHEPWISVAPNDPRTEEEMRADYFRKIAEAKQPAPIVDYGWGPLIVKPTHDGTSAIRQAFEAIIASLNYDGADVDGLTVGEIRRALP